jgi:hypothetical protein
VRGSGFMSVWYSELDRIVWSASNRSITHRRLGTAVSASTSRVGQPCLHHQSPTRSARSTRVIEASKTELADYSSVVVTALHIAATARFASHQPTANAGDIHRQSVIRPWRRSKPKRMSTVRALCDDVAHALQAITNTMLAMSWLFACPCTGWLQLGSSARPPPSCRTPAAS